MTCSINGSNRSQMGEEGCAVLPPLPVVVVVVVAAAAASDNDDDDDLL